ncbi:response regulator [Flavobacteriaceae bacterium TP-CH-4]|uniref:Response regulator n=1 Tax=Pelagihabitans pacificus TaxID=2696054 RepID=A0A967ECX1_9FLAO|nr:response regulator [Pelagihabitans pacificus]NHF58728.1 response regulator [Pelagihabitans pacificus]
MKLRVIVIDDSPVQLLMAARLIAQNEHLTLLGAYANPLLGLMAVNSMEVDMVLLDVEMPEMDGFELKAQLTKQVPVVMNSTRPTFEPMAFEAGASDFLSKPLTASGLEGIVSKIRKSREIELNEKVVTAIAS